MRRTITITRSISTSRRRCGRAARLLLLALAAIPSAPASGAAAAQQDVSYLTPSPAIVKAIDGSVQPTPIVSPSRDIVALVDQTTMPTIAELAQPLLRLAGQRINPATNNIHFSYRSPNVTGITLRAIAGDKTAPVPLPKDGGAFGAFQFSPDGRRIALTRAATGGVELWMVEVATGAPRRVTGAVLNGTWGNACEWADDSKALLCLTIPAARGAAPQPKAVPSGPKVQQYAGPPAPVRTNQDTLTSAYDEQLFEYYFTSQLALVDADSGQLRALGQPGIYDAASLSPDGHYVLVSRIKAPYSRLVTATDFAKDIEILDDKGARVRKVGELPLAEAVAIEGVKVGPRDASWNPVKPAAVDWVEALDEGKPSAKVPFRDRVVELGAPFSGEAKELIKTEYRYQSLAWTERGLGLVTEYDRGKRWTRTWVLDGGTAATASGTGASASASAAPRKLFDRSSEDRYGDPGVFVRRPAGQPPVEFGPPSDRIVMQQGDTLFLASEGASPEGDRPFLDKLDLRSGKSERLFRSSNGSYENVLALLTDDGRSFLTRKETTTSPSNVYVHASSGGAAPRALTAYVDPAPELSAAEKQLLTYERKDGVKLSAILYTPKSRKPGEKLPVILWAYPREFGGADAASQVIGSPYRFNLAGFRNLHLVLLLQGYAVLIPTMPIVGSGETANDTYVEQLVANAQAAVDKVVEIGVADRARIGVAGHSYGAFMTANLLAHSDLFRAGAALSGAYNRTLTPFGFQNERRTFWEKPDLYARMSPFWYAHKVNEPILLFHGEVDNNQGTFPIQTERFYMALKGHGATVRYIVLPHESHVYAGRETLLHLAAEYVDWFDRYVKNAPPPAPGKTPGTPASGAESGASR
jgi:dipeptidyl aminopeptidase/acylaminoacyl peptidase